MDGGQTPNQGAAPPPSPTAQSEPQSTTAGTPAPAGELPVASGVVTLDGEGTDFPLRRETVEPFAIAETEVTNEQYNEFVKETGGKPPKDWNRGEYPADIPNNPVAGVSWQEAVDYCDWLSKKIGATVRLPSEKEWVLAAAGPQNFQFPWGNEWNPRAANHKEEKGGVIIAVKSYPDFRSPSGAYDMAGNVWEWVSDDALDQNGKQLTTGGVKHKIIKGGSAGAERKYLMNRARYDLPMNTRLGWIGFRYVVIRNNAGLPAAP